MITWSQLPAVSESAFLPVVVGSSSRAAMQGGAFDALRADLPPLRVPTKGDVLQQCSSTVRGHAIGIVRVAAVVAGAMCDAWVAVCRLSSAGGVQYHRLSREGGKRWASRVGRKARTLPARFSTTHSTAGAGRGPSTSRRRRLNINIRLVTLVTTYDPDTLPESPSPSIAMSIASSCLPRRPGSVAPPRSSSRPQLQLAASACSVRNP